jgi:hypothetical protein
VLFNRPSLASEHAKPVAVKPFAQAAASIHSVDRRSSREDDDEENDMDGDDIDNQNEDEDEDGEDYFGQHGARVSSGAASSGAACGKEARTSDPMASLLVQVSVGKKERWKKPPQASSRAMPFSTAKELFVMSQGQLSSSKNNDAMQASVAPATRPSSVLELTPVLAAPAAAFVAHDLKPADPNPAKVPAVFAGHATSAMGAAAAAASEASAPSEPAVDDDSMSENPDATSTDGDELEPADGPDREEESAHPPQRSGSRLPPTEHSLESSFALRVPARQLLALTGELVNEEKLIETEVELSSVPHMSAEAYRRLAEEEEANSGAGLIDALKACTKSTLPSDEKAFKQTDVMNMMRQADHDSSSEFLIPYMVSVQSTLGS